MKNIVILSLGFFGILHQANASPVVGSVFISEKRNSAATSFQNTLTAEVYCEQIRFSYKVVGNEFGEPLGEFSEVLPTVYMQPKQELVSKELARGLNRFSTKNRIAIISDAQVDFFVLQRSHFF